MNAMSDETTDSTPLSSRRGLFQNRVSLAGLGLASVSFSLGLFLLIADWWLERPNPYRGALTYMGVPMFVIAGLLIAVLGAWRERKRRARGGQQAMPSVVVDLNRPRDRTLLLASLSAGSFLVLLAAVGSYRAYEFTESVSFCGQLCHSVMNPERAAYVNSPHARIACTQCHVGPGVTSYAMAKLAGMTRLYAVFTNTYRRPIPTPIYGLRPATEVCEQCHWSGQFYGSMGRDYQHYLSDEKNTPWRVHLLINVGGANPRFGPASGIHWHMAANARVYYAPQDQERQKIPWVKVVGADGKETVFIAEDSGLSYDNPPVGGPVRQVDCLDCHNRPAHVFDSPVHATNQALAEGSISASLPFVRQKVVELLSQEYPSGAVAEKTIGDSLRAFYTSDHVQSGGPEVVEKAVVKATEIYRQNFFPDMKVTWKVHPSNIGHLTSPGCFRCHDGRHKAKDGRVISNNCNACHKIIEQGLDGKLEASTSGLEFKHPSDIGDVWKEVVCSDCHTGGAQ